MKPFLVYLIAAATILGTAACQNTDSGPTAPDGYVKYHIHVVDGTSGFPIQKGSFVATDTTGTGQSSPQGQLDVNGFTGFFTLPAKSQPKTLQMSVSAGVNGYEAINTVVDVEPYNDVAEGKTFAGTVKMYKVQ